MIKIALLFPGQGSQYVGMGKKFTDKTAAAVFQEASDVLGIDVADLCFNSDMAILTKTENAQIAILTTSIAMYRCYVSEFGYTPSIVAGHSLGEYSALTASGALDFPSALKLVQKRSQLMQQASADNDGSMLAAVCSDSNLMAVLCKEVSKDDSLVVTANYNSIDQIILSGHKDAVERAQNRLNELHIKNQILKVSGAFHSPLMSSAAEQFKEFIQSVAFAKPSIPVVSNVSANIYKDENEIKDLLVRQITNPVKWKQTIDFLIQNCITIAVEMGPKSVLKNLMRDEQYIEAFSFDDPKSKSLLETKIFNKEKRSEFNKREGINIFNKCMAIAVSSRNRNPENINYEEGVNKPYRLLKELNDEYKDREPESDKIEEALRLLKKILDTKQVPAGEQIERFRQAMDETLTRDKIQNLESIIANA